MTAEVVERLAVVMSELLGRRIGADENFFDAGLDSATIVRAHRRVTGAGPAPFPITDLFARPNLRALAAHLADTSAPIAGRSADGRVADLRRRAVQRRRSRRQHDEEDR